MMLRIEVDIPRPLETLIVIAVVTGVIMWLLCGGGSTAYSRTQAQVPLPDRVRMRTSPPGDAGEGGADRAAMAIALREAESDASRIRMEQSVLSHREEILRYELRLLEQRFKEAEHLSDAERAVFRSAEEELLRLIRDQHAAEERFRQTLNAMWEAEGISATIAVGERGDLALEWPVEPALGLSAIFLDEKYEERFGIPHHAIDVPVEQGSPVRAAADGEVEKVVDGGLGYSYLIIRHQGFATVYGHMSTFSVSEGQQVRQGEVIGSSGGMPGTEGAGALTTGPHLHFELIVEGKQVDPFTNLPFRAEVDAQIPG
jgi:murein DD-endopeptidase MepM/ murein hydrolase activator NlpD